MNRHVFILFILFFSAAKKCPSIQKFLFEINSNEINSFRTYDCIACDFTLFLILFRKVFFSLYKIIRNAFEVLLFLVKFSRFLVYTTTLSCQLFFNANSYMHKRYNLVIIFNVAGSILTLYSYVYI